MSTRYPGGLITKTPVVPTLSSAPGVWTLEQALAYIKAGTWPFPGALDPYFNQTTLLLHGDGNQGATNLYNSGSPAYLAFADNSNNNFPITVQGDAYGSVFSPYEANYSNFFDGNDYLSVPDNDVFELGSGNFTIEAWVNNTSFNSQYNVIVSRWPGSPFTQKSWGVRMTSTYIGFLHSTTGNNDVVNNFNTTNNTNTWYHVAIVRNGNTLSCYKDGVLVGSVSFTDTIFTSTSSLTVGILTDLNSTTGLIGYISNLRVVKGTAVYTSAFTPPTAPLTAIANTSLLTCQSNRFLDNSSNNFTVTKGGDTTVAYVQPFTLAANDNGSGYFDGSGDGIDGPVNTNLGFGSNNFTVEFWAYIFSTSGVGYFASVWGNSGESDSNSSWLIRLNNNGTLITHFMQGSSTLNTLTSGQLTTNAWFHCAYTRSGNTIYLFINGVLAQSASVTGSMNTAVRPFRSGYQGAATNYLNGYVSNLRVVNGTALYTSNFTPPTTPLTNITNTQLLTCQYSGSVNNSGFIDNGPYDFSLTKVGNATQGTFSPFSLSAGYWSNYFDGSGDRLDIPSNSAFNLESGPYCVEFFLYWFVAADNVRFVVFEGTSQSVGLVAVGGGVTLDVNLFGIGSRLIATNALSGKTNQWVHIVLCSNGTNRSLYVNGARVATTTNSLLPSTDCSVSLGGNYVRFALTNLNGQLSNVRIVKGSQVYDPTQTTLTVPTTPLTAIANTSLLTCQSNRFRDASSNNFTVTPNGDVKVTAFSPFLPTAPYSISTNGGSLSLDGSGDYIRRGTSGNAAFNFGSGNFTIEMFVYQNALKNYASFVGEVPGTTNNSIHFGSAADGSIFVTLTSTNTQINAPAGTCRAGQWQHIALVRNSGVTTLYVDGTSRGTPFSSSANMGLGQSVGFVIGSGHGGGDLNGYISNVRILKGVAQYTTTFTPPTAPLTPVANTSLLCNFTNAGIFDNTGKNALETVGNAQVDTSVRKYGIGSMKFDGTGDWLVCNGSNDLYAFGTGDWTIELWLYLNNVSGQKNLYDSVPPSTSGAYPTIYVLNATLYYYTNNANRITNSNSLLINTWYHIAVARSGTSTRMFVDGTQVGSTYTDNSNYLNGGTNRPIIGGSAFSPGGALHNGYIDDLRITKGVARYTTNFTPPTRAFPNQ